MLVQWSFCGDLWLIAGGICGERDIVDDDLPSPADSDDVDQIVLLPPGGPSFSEGGLWT